MACDDPDLLDVLVRVEPRLLSDALRVVLRDAGLRVAACPVGDRRSEPRAARRYDLAVVIEEPPADASCDRVIRIDERGAVNGGPAGLAQLLEEVRRALPGLDLPTA